MPHSVVFCVSGIGASNTIMLLISEPYFKAKFILKGPWELGHQISAKDLLHILDNKKKGQSAPAKWQYSFPSSNHYIYFELRLPNFGNKFPTKVITLCERLAGQDANVTTVPVSVLRLTRQLTRLFEWTSDVADRLAFSEVLTSDTVFSVPMTETYNLLGVDAKDVSSLEKYLQDYFTNILKKLKDLKAQSKQTDIFL